MINWLKNYATPVVLTLCIGAYGGCTLIKVNSVEEKLHDMQIEITYRFTRLETLLKIGNGNATYFSLDTSIISDDARQRVIDYYIGLAKSEVVEEKIPN